MMIWPSSENGAAAHKVASSPPSVRTTWRFASALALTFLLAGCASHYPPGASESPYGLFSGIWHGLVFPYSLMTNLVSWLLSLFGINLLQDIQIVGRPNTGFFFYYIGFMIGLSAYGGAGHAAKSS